MSRVTTALLTAGPKSLSPWGDRAWRVSLVAQLVEGSSAPYWIASPTQPAEHLVSPDSLQVEYPAAECVVESAVETCLVETENVSLKDGVRHIAPYYDVSAPETFGYLTQKLSERVRLSITVLDEFSLVDDEVIRRLRQAGFDVDVYGLVSSGIATS